MTALESFLQRDNNYLKFSWFIRGAMFGTLVAVFLYVL